MKIQYAFTEKTVKKFFDPILKSINSRECISVINIPKRDQLYRVNEFNHKEIKKSIQLIILDLKGEAIEDHKDLNRYINAKVKSDISKVVLLILDADQLLDEKIALLSYLDKLYFDRKKLDLVYFFQKNITSSEFSRKFSPYTSLYQNISVYKYYEPDDLRHFVRYISKNYGIRVPKKLVEKILSNCNGSPWLIKEALRYYSHTDDPKNIFCHDGMKLKLRILYEEFSDREKNVLEKIARNDYSFNAEEKETSQFLLKTRLIDKKNKKIFIRFPILKDYVSEKINSNTEINLIGNRLMINKVIIDQFFSRREKKLLKLFVENKRRLVSRERVALAIWNDSYEASFSDWALDQSIKRLRKKLVDLGLGLDTIKTKKNQGYTYG